MLDDKQKDQIDETRRFYAVLGVATGTELEQIKERYRSLLVHARVGLAGGHTDSLKLQELREAYLALATAGEQRAA
ncbi:MAG: hypothetical protein LJE90_14875 [Betaproteobacteria bacterium]|jgi:DnaJ-class molecular chaperone|nr:hypothetical protein [Betaproteobacteria bacterium]